MQSETPWRTRHGLGSSHFARRYFGNRVFFLFLRLLRCFSSPGSLPYTMDSCMDTGGSLRWVSPFRHLRIVAHLQLPAAFRSLSRLSSALSAKASSLCSFLLNLSDIGLSSLSRLAWRYLVPSQISPGISLLFAYQIFFAVQICSAAQIDLIMQTCFAMQIYSALYISRCTPRMSCISRLQT